MNWFLYIVKEGFFLEDECTSPYVRPGAGVGKCSMGAGIIDAPYGMMYIVPGKYIDEKVNPHGRRGDYENWPGYVADQVKDLIADYYGIPKPLS